MKDIILHFIKIINHRLKSPLFNLILTIILIIVIFTWGKIYIINQNQEYFTIHQNANNKQIINKKTIFSSKTKRSKYYYYLGCGGQSIKKENIIYFSSEQEAEANGKILHPKCK